MKMIKLLSWNVNGIRAAIKKGFFDSINQLNPDIICLQEIKINEEELQTALFGTNFNVYGHFAEKKGYSGTAILSKKKPTLVQNNIGIEEHDKEGRVITAEFSDFYLVNVYVPNSKRDLSRLEYRKKWDFDFLQFVLELEKTKPVVVCGDFNVAHTNIDLARPKQNYNKQAGYTQIEIDGIDAFIKKGFIDTFRFLNPNKTDAYTWWSYMGNARENNVGWRIDYFLTSSVLKNNIKGASIHPSFMESDHCPIDLTLEL